MPNGTVRSISVRLLAEVGNYVQGIGRAKAATGDLITELSKSEQARQNFQRLGTGMLVAGAGIAAGIGLATKAAIDWETAWAGVVKTVDGTDAQLAALEDELREMARTLPASHAEIAAVAEAAGQLGIATEDVASFTRTMIDLGVTTNLTAQEAAVSIAQLANVMGTSTDDVDNLGAAIVDLGNNSATTEADIVAMAQRIAGAGATIGLSEADVLGFSAALASVGINAEAGGSAISRAMIEIESAVRDGGDELETLAEVAGMSAAEFSQAYEDDAAGAIATFIEGLGQMQASGQDVFQVLDQLGFSEIRLRDALLRLASSGDTLNRSLDRSAEAWGDNVALAEEAEKRYDSTAAQLQIARNQINDFAISMGETFLPVLGDVAERVGSFAEFMAELPGPVQAVIGTTAALTAGILLLGGTAITAVTKIAAYRAAMASLQAQGGATATAVGRVNRGLRGAVVWGGRAAVAFAGLQIAGQVVSSVFGDQLEPNLEATELGLRRWAETGEVSGEAARVMGQDFEHLETAIADLGREGFWTQVGRGIARFAEFFHDDFEGSLARAEERLSTFDAAMAQMVRSGNLEDAAQAWSMLTDMAEEQGVSMEDLTALFPQYQAALELAEEQSGDTGDGMTQMGDDAAAAAEDVDALKEAFDRLFGIQMDIDRATIAYHQGLRDLTAELQEGTRTLDLNTQAGLDNSSALLDQVDKIKDVREANIESGMAIEDANELYQQQIDDLVDLAVQAGFNEDEIRDLIDAYRDIPERVTTDVHTNFTSSGRPPAGLAADGRQAYNRHGGVYVNRDGGVYAAQHGLLRRAAIFPPRSPATFAFAEPATGGEAFIPRLGDTARSLAIADVAAQWHGGRVVAGDGASQLGAAQQFSMGSPTIVNQITVVAQPSQRGDELADALMRTISYQVERRGGGNVQDALGTTGVRR